MITIKNNCYNDREKEAITRLLLTAKNELNNTYCNAHNDTCDTCPYKHVCYDIEKAFDYCKRELNVNESN